MSNPSPTRRALLLGVAGGALTLGFAALAASPDSSGPAASDRPGVTIDPDPAAAPSTGRRRRRRKGHHAGDDDSHRGRDDDDDDDDDEDDD